MTIARGFTNYSFLAAKFVSTTGDEPPLRKALDDFEPKFWPSTTRSKRAAAAAVIGD